MGKGFLGDCKNKFRCTVNLAASLQQWFVRCVVDVVATAAANENQTHMLSVGRPVDPGARSPGRAAAAAAATEQQASGVCQYHCLPVT